MRLIILLALSVYIAALAGCAPTTETEMSLGTVPAEGDTARALPELDTYSLISIAVAEGEIDYSTGLLYKVYAMYDPLSLPSEYRSDVPGKCGTPLIDEVRRNWNRLAPADQAEISQYIQPIGQIDEGETQLDDVTPERLDQERTSVD